MSETVKLIVTLSKGQYENLKDIQFGGIYSRMIFNAVKNGIPLDDVKAECRAEAYGLTYEEVWKSDAFSSSWNRRGIEPNEDCKEAIALFEEGWVPKPLYFRAGHYHSFGTELCQVGNHYFSTK